MNKSIKVSVVITCFNRENFIADAIESALSQDYSNLEIIISDNNSTDKSFEIINRYKKDKRIKINKNHKNIGALPNFRKCAIELATGDYITFISSDDYLCNNSFISEAIDRINNNNNIVIVKGRNKIRNEKSNTYLEDHTYYKWKRKYYNKRLIEGKTVFLDYPESPSIGFGGALYKRKYFSELGFTQNEKVYYQDAEITLKILLNGNASFISTETYVIRLHDGNDTGVISLQRIIDNCEHIESPYQLAKMNQIFNNKEIENWRYKMYTQYFMQHFKATFENNLIHNSLKIWLIENKPEIYNKINNSLKWNLYKLLIKNNFIKSIYPALGLLKVKFFN